MLRVAGQLGQSTEQVADVRLQSWRSHRLLALAELHRDRKVNPATRLTHLPRSGTLDLGDQALWALLG